MLAFSPFFFSFFFLVTKLFVPAFCQVSLDPSSFLYEMNASEKPVQEILVYYPYMLWNVLKIFYLVFFEIMLHIFFQSFTKELSLWMKSFELKQTKKIEVSL